MRHVLIDMLGAGAACGLSEDGELVRLAMSGESEKPAAIHEAYLKLAIARAPDEVAFITGPGNFTSIRAGLGFARGLGLGFGCETRGVDIFTLDYALAVDAPADALLVRNARGGYYYHAQFRSSELAEVTLVEGLSKAKKGQSGQFWSAEELPFKVMPIKGGARERMEAFARLAHAKAGKCPARAFYVRPPRAELPRAAAIKLADG